MNIKIRFFATMFVAIGFITCISSCAKDDEYLGNGNDIFATEKTGEGDDAIVLGEKMNDPYNMAFMSEAFQQLKAEGTELPFDVLEPTGLYVRVLAGSTAELDLLEADTNMTWFDFPLDYEIISNGTYYHDPTLPDSATWKYGVIPMNYSLPSSLQHELLYNVFIPDDYPEYEKYEEEFDRLEEISESLCGYEEEDDEKEISTKASKWNPSATIEVWDDAIEGNIPLQGAKVTVRRCTKYRSKITDANGYCFFEAKFKKEVNYGITWERAYWDIRNGFGIQVYYNGPKQKGAWNLTISGQKSLMYSTMHRALLIAFYGTWGGIHKPTASHKLKVAYLDNYSESSLAWNICTWNIFGSLNNISVHGRDNNNNYLKTYKLFGNLTHELGHQSMLRYVGGTWNFAAFSYTAFIRESYACAVEWSITNDYYRNTLGDSDYKHYYDYQWWTREKDENGDFNEYTPIFIDLMDNYNQNIFNQNRCKDNVSGYTLQEIQDEILATSYGEYSLRQTLKSNLKHGATAAQIDELLDNYINLGF